MVLRRGTDICVIGESTINSSPPSAAYMRQWIGSALVQIMAWRLFGAKPLSKPMLGYYEVVIISLRNKLQWNFKQNAKLFIHYIAAANIVKMRDGGHFAQGEMSIQGSCYVNEKYLDLKFKFIYFD